MIYTLSLHDALPIFTFGNEWVKESILEIYKEDIARYRIMLGSNITEDVEEIDRKSTRLNSSHVAISYAVFCLKKKNTIKLEEKQMIANNKSNVRQV